MWIDNEPTLSPPAVYQTSTTITSFDVTGGILAGQTTYYWRVIAVNSAGSTAATPNPAAFTTTNAPPPPPFCNGDANADGQVGFTDITDVLTFWGITYTPGSRGRGDANNDGLVNFADISTVLQFWGVPCP